MVIVSFVNYFEVSVSLASFQLSSSTESSNSIEGLNASLFASRINVSVALTAAESTELQMFPVVVQQLQQQQHAMHHRVRDEIGEDAAVERPPPPVQWPPRKGSDDECRYARDFGLLERLANSSRSFCNGLDDSSPYSFYQAAGLSATKLETFTLDVRGAEVAHDIANLAEDGGGHDPRFKFIRNSSMCSCSEVQDKQHGAPNIWRDFFVGGPGGDDSYCVAPPANDSGNNSVAEVVTVERAVVLVRKDDHNPFFQISTILDAWIMLNVLGWERSSTQLVTMDRALPTPVDELRHAILGPERPVVGGEVFQNRVVHFKSALLAPYETSGPMMSHLDDNQPCHANALLSAFRDVALKSMGLVPRDAKTDPRRCLVTVISRRPYGGRRVQRVWQNEDEIVQLMREEYKDAYRFGECEFQSLDFVNMTMYDQMRVMLDSDVVIGMHGAGMVNVMWTRPDTLVVEIFPRARRRWGYRNLCQYLGCNWVDFRKGRDVRIHTSDPNDLDKRIPYKQWRSFFDPLFTQVIARLEQQIEGS